MHAHLVCICPPCFYLEQALWEVAPVQFNPTVFIEHIYNNRVDQSTFHQSVQ